MKIQDEDHFIQLPNLEMFEAQYKKKIYIHNLKSTKSLFMVLWTYFDHLFIARPISISHLTRCRFRGRHQITPIRSDSIPRRAISHPRILADSWPYKPHRSLHGVVVAMNHGSYKAIFIILNCSLGSVRLANY